MKCDLHVHTEFSSDSTEAMESHCVEALRLGVQCICFTDHVDNNPHDLGYGYYQADRYFEALGQVRHKYGDRLKLLSGIEFSEPHAYPESFSRYASLPYDFIMGSVHFFLRGLFPSEMVKEGIPPEECYDAYWDEIADMVACGGFDCIGHLDFPKRYYRTLVFDPERLLNILALAVRKGIVLEINSSSIRKGLTEPMPGPDLLRIYKQAGGTYYTIGSDAHSAVDLYADVDTSRSFAESLGLTEVYFEKRVMHLA